jgi:predicted RNA methylase
MVESKQIRSSTGLLRPSQKRYFLEKSRIGYLSVMDQLTTPEGEASRKTAAVVDLFCGAGGLAYGLKVAGLEVVAGVDLDAACRHPLEKNVSSWIDSDEFKEVTTSDAANVKSKLQNRFEFVHHALLDHGR